MCEWPNCDQGRTEIASIVAGRGKRNSGKTTQITPSAEPTDCPSPKQPTFTLKRIEKPIAKDNQLDIRNFMVASPKRPPKRVTKYSTNPNAKHFKPTAVSETPHTHDGELKPAARVTKRETEVFVKCVSGSRITYVAVENGVLERDNLPCGIALSLDLDGPDPSRTIVEVEPGVDDIPDFVLNAIATEKDITAVVTPEKKPSP